MLIEIKSVSTFRNIKTQSYTYLERIQEKKIRKKPNFVDFFVL